MESLVFESVTKKYQDGKREHTVIDNLDFSLEKGQLVAIIGPSGSGKSTLLSMAGALLTPSAGKVYIDDQEITGMSQKELTKIRLESIGFIFQGSQLVSYLTVLEQLQIINDLAKKGKEQDDDFAKNLLRDLGLEERMHAYPEELSGGEKQRVAIARSFMNNPSVILADEPTANLDEKRGYQVVEMIRDEVGKRNKEGIIVTHDNRLLDLMDKVYLLENGKLKEYQL